MISETEEEQNRSLTFTELELKIRAVEQQNKQVEAHLNQIKVPELPSATLITGSQILNYDMLIQDQSQSSRTNDKHLFNNGYSDRSPVICNNCNDVKGMGSLSPSVKEFNEYER